jgi:hypothetical protein
MIKRQNPRRTQMNRIMRRGVFIFFWVVVMAVAAASAWCKCDWESYGSSWARHGQTNITWPEVLYTVNIDNYGNITGSGSQVKISHSDSGAFCHKVAYVAVCAFVRSSKKNLLVRPGKKDLNLCNFNERDATFDLVFPGTDNPQEIQKIFDGWVRACQGGYPADLTGAPWRSDGVAEFLVSIRWANNDFTEYTPLKYPKVVLNCAPCPPLNIRNSINVKANTPVTLPPSSFALSGIPPYSVTFQGLPNGMRQDSQTNTLTGTPTTDKSTDFRTKVTVRDSCKSQVITSRTKTVDFTFRITDPTPPMLSGFSISPTILPATGGDVVLQVTASDNAAVTDVTAAVSGPGWAMRVFVTRVSGTATSGVWRGTYKAPPNTTARDVAYTVDFIAADSDGNKSKSVSGTFVVKGKP